MAALFRVLILLILPVVGVLTGPPPEPPLRTDLPPVYVTPSP